MCIVCIGQSHKAGKYLGLLILIIKMFWSQSHLFVLLAVTFHRAPMFSRIE